MHALANLAKSPANRTHLSASGQLTKHLKQLIEMSVTRIESQEANAAGVLGPQQSHSEGHVGGASPAAMVAWGAGVPVRATDRDAVHGTPLPLTPQAGAGVVDYGQLGDAEGLEAMIGASHQVEGPVGEFDYEWTDSEDGEEEQELPFQLQVTGRDLLLAVHILTLMAGDR